MRDEPMHAKVWKRQEAKGAWRTVQHVGGSTVARGIGEAAIYLVPLE